MAIAIATKTLITKIYSVFLAVGVFIVECNKSLNQWNACTSNIAIYMSCYKSNICSDVASLYLTLASLIVEIYIYMVA